MYNELVKLAQILNAITLKAITMVVVGLIAAALVIWLAIALYARYVQLYPQVFDLAGVSKEDDHFSDDLQKDYVTDKTGAKIEIARIGELNTSKPVILYFFGRSGRTPSMMRDMSKYATVVSPAYRGYYSSEGEASPEALRDVVDVSISYLLQKGYSRNSIIVIGHSVGGAAALYASVNYPELPKVILINTFYSIQSMCEPQHGIACALMGDYTGSARLADRTAGRIVMYQTRADIYVSQQESKKLYDALSTTDKEYHLIDGEHGKMDMQLILGDLK